MAQEITDQIGHLLGGSPHHLGLGQVREVSASGRTVRVADHGEVGLKVERSQFKYAELTGMEVLADIAVDDSVLKLEGAVSGKVHEDYTVDLLGSISVREDFTYKQGQVTATLKSGGSVGVEIEQSQFKSAEWTDLVAVADIAVDGSVLELEGAVSGKIHEDYKIDLLGSLTLQNDFT